MLSRTYVFKRDLTKFANNSLLVKNKFLRGRRNLSFREFGRIRVEKNVIPAFRIVPLIYFKSVFS